MFVPLLYRSCRPAAAGNRTKIPFIVHVSWYLFMSAACNWKCNQISLCRACLLAAARNAAKFPFILCVSSLQLRKQQDCFLSFKSWLQLRMQQDFSLSFVSLGCCPESNRISIMFHNWVCSQNVSRSFSLFMSVNTLCPKVEKLEKLEKMKSRVSWLRAHLTVMPSLILTAM